MAKMFVVILCKLKQNQKRDDEPKQTVLSKLAECRLLN